MKRFLITTPLEETWRRDEPVLFLGEWCLAYPRQLSDLGMDAVVMPYHWDDRRKMFEDYKYISSLYEVVLERLFRKLNEIHSVDHGLRYWRILIGPWLGFFMLLLFDRWSSIQQAVRNYELSGSIALRESDADFIPNDMHDFSYFFLYGDEWNHYIYARILEQFSSAPLYREHKTKSFTVKRPPTSGSVKTKIRQLLKSLVSQIGSPFSNEEDSLLLATYLSKKEELALCVRLGQCPRFLSSPAALKTTADFSQRNWVLEEDAGSEFEACLGTLLPQQIPSAYLEGYKKLVEQTEALLWPRRPKAIWTSNAFYLDDVFKAWAGSKVESGAPLIIGQHGGNYGMGLWNWGEQHELAISDSYWTWGWSRPSMSKLRPVGKIKYSRPVKRYSKDGYAILVTVMLQRYGNPTLSMYSSSQWLNYLKDQFDFVEALPVGIQNKLIVRLSRDDYGWHQVERWRDRFPRLKLNDGFSDLNKLARNSRLYISTYNATTYLESLSMNIPTVIYWNPRYMETNAWAQPYFDELRSVGIFHETPQSAAAHVTAIWDDVDTWWTNPETRRVRDLFVKQFANCPKNKIGQLKNAINEVINQC